LCCFGTTVHLGAMAFGVTFPVVAVAPSTGRRTLRVMPRVIRKHRRQFAPEIGREMISGWRGKEAR
jgi:hypothetical protein